MYTFINGIDKTGNVLRNSIQIDSALQERVDSASFGISGYKPDYFDDVGVYEGFPIYNYTSGSITLQKKYNEAIQNNLFRVGEYVNVNLPNGEKKLITSISEDVSGYISNNILRYEMEGNVNDISGNGYNGSLSGSPSLTSNQLGEVNSAYSFNGTSQYITTPTLVAPSIDGYTICYWFNPVLKLTRSRPFAGGTVTTHFYGNAGGSGTNLTWFVGNGTSFSGGRTAGAFVTFGSWQFVAITYDKVTGKLYKNGVLTDTQSYASASINMSVAFGYGQNSGNYCEGSFGEARIYTKALSSDEILALYNEGLGQRTTDGNIKLNFSDFTTLPTVGNLAGKKKFAGNIVDIQDSNSQVLSNVEFKVTALDYTRVFDKKLINDTFTDRDSRYIVNDFCNTTINKNIEIEEFNYADTTALRTIWTNSPTLETSDYREGSGCMTFSYAPAGTGSTVATLTPINTSEISGGRLAFWYNVTNASSVTIYFGNDASNHVKKTFTPEVGWIFYDVLFSDMTLVGTVNYASIDYVKVEVVSTGSAVISIDGVRVLEDEFFRHYPYVQESVGFDDFRVNRVKPTETMQRLADSLAWYWYVDYDKYIHLFPNTTIIAPFSLNETSNNFANLSITHDTSRLINRQIVRGAEETSDSIYNQVIEGNSVAREWIMKNKFKNLIVKLNDGSSTDTMEATTNTTTVKATAHGLVSGDYIVNRTRSNAVRKITFVDANTFTVDAVTSQTSGDSFSLFVSKTVGVEGISEEASFNYFSNFNQKSIRSSQTETTLTSGQFLLFSYNEVVPILVQRTDNVSMSLMKSILGYSDGIFDGQPIVDQTITSRSEAIKMAEAIINKYSNVVITATFTTEQEGLEVGQLIRITDTTSSERNIDKDFVIQSIKSRQLAWGENRYVVTCSSLLFGMLELLQQILANNRKIKVNEDEVINNIEDANETMIIADTLGNVIDGEINAETMIIADTLTNDVYTPPFLWGDVGGGPSEFQWDMSSWG